LLTAINPTLLDMKKCDGDFL